MTNFEYSQFKLLINTIDDILKTEINKNSEEWIINMLDKNLQFLYFTLNDISFPILERMTINRNVLGENRRIHDSKFLKHPPKDRVKKYGRCNLIGQSIFYASALRTTALSEMRPKVGDLITKSIWALNKKDKRIRVAPIFGKQPNNGIINPRTLEIKNQFFELVNQEFTGNRKKAIIDLSMFIAENFTKSVSTNHYLYIISAYFTNKIFENGDIDGIYYPSVKEKLSFENIALKVPSFEANYHLESVQESLIIKDPTDGEGGYLMYGINESNKFVNNNIIWNNSINHQIKKDLKYYEKKYNFIID